MSSEREETKPMEGKPEELKGWRLHLPLWLGLLAAPVAWFIHLNIGYTVGAYLCTGSAVWIIYGATVACLAVAAGGAGCAALLARRTRAGAGGQGTAERRTHFMALGGVILSAFFFLSMVVAVITTWILEPCQGW